MTMTRGSGWIFIVIGALVASVRFVEIRELWPVFGLYGWVMFTICMLAPPMSLWRYLKIAQGTAEQVGSLGVSIALGGYVPLWFGLSLAERVAKG